MLVEVDCGRVSISVAPGITVNPDLAYNIGVTSRGVDLLVLLLTSENTDASIARRLCVSRQTVKNHFTKLLRTLGVNDRTAAICAASNRGIIGFAPTIDQEVTPIGQIGTLREAAAHGLIESFSLQPDCSSLAKGIFADNSFVRFDPVGKVTSGQEDTSVQQRLTELRQQLASFQSMSPDFGIN